MTKPSLPACYFYHIPKTAGMSTWQLLEWLYPEEKICPGRMWEDIIRVPMKVMGTYDAFRGHFLAYLGSYLDRELSIFTILRDPVERTISHYSHVRRSPEHPFHAKAKVLTLAEFCLHPLTHHMVRNYQAGYLACPEKKNPRELAKRMSNEDLSAYKLQLALDPSPGEFHDANALYRAGYDRLRSFLAVGITERLQESLTLIARRLGASAPPEFGRRNVGNLSGLPDDRTIGIIRACTEVDHALYCDETKRFECDLEAFSGKL